MDTWTEIRGLLPPRRYATGLENSGVEHYILYSSLAIHNQPCIMAEQANIQYY